LLYIYTVSIVSPGSWDDVTPIETFFQQILKPPNFNEEDIEEVVAIFRREKTRTVGALRKWKSPQYEKHGISEQIQIEILESLQPGIACILLSVC
jgi:hypothetical protein